MQSSAGTDVLEDTKTQFLHYAKQFMEALSGTFPNCAQTRAALLKFTMAVEQAPTLGLRDTAGDTLIDAYTAAMAPYYSRVAARDAGVFRQLESVKSMAKEVGLADKYETADEDTRDCIWDYLQRLNSCSQLHKMYKAVPGGMMMRIQEVAQQLASQMEDGGGLGNLNIAALGQSVVNTVDPDEMNAFAQAMMQDQSTLAGLASFCLQHAGGRGGGGPAP